MFSRRCRQLGAATFAAGIVSAVALMSGNAMAAEACAGEGGLTKSGTIVATAKSDVYAFTFGQKGLMAGMGLQGSKITRLNR